MRRAMMLAICVAFTAGCMPPRNDVPIVLRPNQHEAELLAWRPAFTANVPNFDKEGRPYIRSRTASLDETGFVHALDGVGWTKLDFLEAVRKAVPEAEATARSGGWLPSRIVFDADDHAYTLLQVRLKSKATQNLLLYSRDHCRSWQVYPLPPGEFTLEHWTGHNEIAGPPPIGLLTKVGEHPARWASLMELSVLFPRKTADGLELGEPEVVTDRCFGMAQHSGGASFAATKGGKTFIVWGEVTYKPGERAAVTAYRHRGSRGRREHLPMTHMSTSGSPTYVAAYDHKTRTLGPSKLVGYAPPPDDCHNTPGISVDSTGHLHIITGAHGMPFHHVRSRKPLDAEGKWVGPDAILKTGYKTDEGKEEARQTYLAMVIDAEGTIHVVFRQWRQGVDEHHGGKNYAALSYQRKRKGRHWEDARPLVIAPVPGYSIYYHKLALDRRGRLFLSYSYWSTTPPYKDAPGRYNHRALLASPDGGDTWRLASTEDFQ